ncbi:dTDP-4-dehydrorhamnose reductase [Orenia marismortui]|uniref:dTDP-4-dehydrorhamnose reductase n=1 Tax=Orenia marismortui TaxID=46469 RepID=A0A4R8H011_9FIRM|nr:dTDP-4-dehydrorhamnose reductase [Orenia marismortui]TDX52357.1 dTDP-4-dehydrorhamnose reductase [Orenia marismortui]
MRILITGGNGLLGTELKLSLEEDYEVYAWDKKELDITFAQEAIAKIVDLNPDLVIHTAAYTDADACERNIDLAYQINAYGSRNIVVACQESNAEMIYISSDYIFDGKKGEAYCEFDRPNPLNIYGKSKLAGEEFVKNLVNKYFIVRTAWLYGKYGNNFVKTMLRLSTEEDVLTVVNDQIGSPTYTKDLVQAIKELIGTKLYGTYHLTNLGEVSWYQFAKKIFEYSNIEIEVKAVSSQEFIRAATRPNYSALNNYALKQGLGYQMRDWKVALRDYLHNG